MTSAVDKPKCASSGCTADARMALRTTRPSRGSLVTTVWWDDRTAPKSAQRLCRHHGAALLSGLPAVLVDGDTTTRTAGENGA